MGEVTSTWTVGIRSVEVGEDFSVGIRRTSMDSPIVNIDEIAKNNIASLESVPIANVKTINGVSVRDYKWRVTITAP